MLNKLVLVLLLFGIGVGFSVPEKVTKKADKVMSKFYETESLSKEFILISEDANEATSSDFGLENFFKIYDADRFLGYGYIGNAPSKTATFDYLVLFDPDFIITTSKVLIYREEYGGEIGSRRWLKQFSGKTAGTPELKYNEDIIPISGATISVRSMTRAMNDLLQSIALLQQLNQL
ncbi:MAG: FMN-binding protein [Flavobacteriaceae bacterium]|nr:FMN-binding protein [Flavobacteriaceae bacterium]